MYKKSTTTFLFSGLLVLSILLFLLGKILFLQPLSSIGTFITMPFQKVMMALFHTSHESDAMLALQKENATLKKKLIDEKKLLAEDGALRDQFKTNKPTNATLLPADVIGAPGLIPGVSQPDSLILNVGSKQGVYIGQAVVVKDTLIGKVEKVSYGVSVVSPIQSISFPFTAKTLATNAIGLVNALDSGGLQFGNVLLSDTLQKGDFVVTKGDVGAAGKGFPPDLLIGKIVSIEKRPSDLFQTAKIMPLVDLSTVQTVFLVSY